MDIWRYRWYIDFDIFDFDVILILGRFWNASDLPLVVEAPTQNLPKKQPRLCLQLSPRRMPFMQILRQGKNVRDSIIWWF